MTKPEHEHIWLRSTYSTEYNAEKKLFRNDCVATVVVFYAPSFISSRKLKKVYTCKLYVANTAAGRMTNHIRSYVVRYAHINMMQRVACVRVADCKDADIASIAPLLVPW